MRTKRAKSPREIFTMNGTHPYVIEHPLLGHLTGRRRNSHVVQFRSIPFGFVPGRFRQASLVETLSPKQRICVDYTYACPQEEQSMDAFGGPLPGEERRRYDEFSCLNLTVTAPAALLEPGCVRKVPVMVYVHGGGFKVGAHFGGPHGEPLSNLLEQSITGMNKAYSPRDKI